INPKFTALSTTKVVFSATDGSHGYELWVTDGTAAGTSMVLDINTSGNSSPRYMTSLGNGKAVFSATDGSANHGYELWVTDGTGAGTSMVLNINSGSLSSYPQDITRFGTGKALFTATDGTLAGQHGFELWVTDGTGAGTSMVKDINPGTGSSLPTAPDSG